MTEKKYPLPTAGCEPACADPAILRPMLDAAPLIMCYIDRRGRFVAANKACASFLGLPVGLIEGAPASAVLPQDEYRRHVRRLRLCLRGETVPFEDERQDRTSGEKRYYQGLCSPQRNSAGKITGFIVCSSDITAFKEAAAAREEAIGFIRDFAGAVTDISCILDEHGRFVEIFRGPQAPAARTDAEIVGRLLEEALPAKVAAKIRGALVLALDSGEMQHSEFAMSFNKVGHRRMQIRLTPMRQLFTDKRVLAGNITDITERVRQERIMHLAYERQRRNHLFNEIISQKITADKAIYLGKEMGINLQQTFSLYLLIAPESGRDCFARIAGIDLLRDGVEDALRDEKSAVVWCNEDGVGVICPALAQGEELKAAERAFAQKLVDDLRSSMPGLRVSLGIAGLPTTVGNMGSSYRRALTAANTGFYVLDKGDVHHFLDIGIYQLLGNLPVEAEADEFATRVIGKLVEYDSRHGTHLMETLGEIMLGNSLGCVAKKLFLHPKTVLFRKRRIEQILGISLDSFETKLTVALALKLWLMRCGRQP